MLHRHAILGQCYRLCEPGAARIFRAKLVQAAVKGVWVCEHS